MAIPAKIWVDQAHMDALPTTGAAWAAVKAWADADWGSTGLVEGASGPIDTAAADRPDVGSEENWGDNHILAMAICHCKAPAARPTSTYLAEVLHGLRTVIGTEIVDTNDYFEVYNIGRNLSGYVVAADMIDLKTVDPVLHGRFKTWLRYLRDCWFSERESPPEVNRVRSITDMVKNKPNNHGTSAEVTLVTIAMYLGDESGVAESAVRLQRLLGVEGTNTDGYKFKMLGPGSWQADPANPVIINRLGATILYDGTYRDVSGAPAEEGRRTGAFAWPPGGTEYANYFYSFGDAFIMWVYLLERCGYTATQYADNACARFWTWCYDYLWVVSDGGGNPALEDLTAVEADAGGVRFFPGSSLIYRLQDNVDAIYLVNHLLGTDYPTAYINPKFLGKPGKAMGHNFYLFGPLS